MRDTGTWCPKIPMKKWGLALLKGTHGDSVACTLQPITETFRDILSCFPKRQTQMTWKLINIILFPVKYMWTEVNFVGFSIFGQ